MAGVDPDVVSATVSRAEGALAARLGVPVDEAAVILRRCAARSGYAVSLERVAAEVLDSCRGPSAPDVAGPW